MIPSMGEHTALFYRFGVALFIGVLVGLQREYSYDESDTPHLKTFAGIRTFSLLGLSGCTAAYVSELLDTPWAFIGVFIPVGTLVAVAYFVTASRGDVGMTTEVAAVVVILCGALAFFDQLALAVALGVITTTLLSLKLELHSFAEQLTRDDVLATVKFALITAIVLPVLPNESIIDVPPFDVLNPYKIWLMVVLISGISFLGYVLIKLVGSHRGVGLTGFLGGLASSTAVTLSLSQRSQRDIDLAKPLALAVTVAWTVMFARVLVEVTAVHAPLLQRVWLPVVAAAVAGLAYSAYLLLAPRAEEQEEQISFTNPFELRPAITFGLLYGLILLLARSAQYYLGESGVYLSSIVSGLADVDAITLSMAELSRSGNLDLVTAGRAVVLATMSNTVVKGGIVLTSGSSQMRRALLPGFVLILVTGVTLALLL